MSNSQQIIVVTGATGQQGGAAARRLQQDGWKVQALVRDAASPQAQALQRAGVELIEGNFNDGAALERAFTGAHGVFSVQPAFGSPRCPPGFGPEEEVRAGKAVAAAAAEAGVRHLVYNSVFAADQGAGVQNMETKATVERYIQELGIPATILRPSSFMENYATFQAFDVGANTLSSLFAAHVVEPMIAVRDIGAFVGLAFARPRDYLGQTVELIGDALTPPQVAAAISAALGRPLRYQQIPVDAIREQLPAVATAFDWFNTTPHEIDLPATRRRHPDVLTFERWLTLEGAQILQRHFG